MTSVQATAASASAAAMVIATSRRSPRSVPPVRR
jgi:hypothetical protein